MVRSTPDFTGFCFSIFRRPQSTVFRHCKKKNLLELNELDLKQTKSREAEKINYNAQFPNLSHQAILSS